MESFPIERYHFEIDEVNKIITASSTYAGKTVRGSAKCDTMDTFNIEIGKALAAARCNARIAEKRMKNANKKYIDAVANMIDARAQYDEMAIYDSDASYRWFQAMADLAAIENKLK